MSWYDFVGHRNYVDTKDRKFLFNHSGLSVRGCTQHAAGVNDHLDKTIDAEALMALLNRL